MVVNGPQKPIFENLKHKIITNSKRVITLISWKGEKGLNNNVVNHAGRIPKIEQVDLYESFMNFEILIFKYGGNYTTLYVIFFPTNMLS